MRSLVLRDKEGICDAFTPVFHIYPPQGGWINDVNAFFYYGGFYHIFYQYSRSPDDTSKKEWLHAVSRDLVKFEQLGVALTFDRPYDSNGVWSGGVFTGEGAPVISYYALGSGICLCRPRDPSDPELREWVKDPLNPVIPVPSGPAPYTVYDASGIFRMGENYCLLTGNKNPLTSRPANFIFLSRDMRKWEFGGEFFSPAYLSGRDDMACPCLVFDGGRAFYTYSSHLTGVHYSVGKIEGGKFKEDFYGAVNAEGGNEMGQSAFIHGGRIIYMSWLTESRRTDELKRSGWSGVLTIPKVVEIKDGRAEFSPHPAVFSLRGEGERIMGDSGHIEALLGSHFELALNVNEKQNREILFELKSGDQTTEIKIGNGAITVDFGHSSCIPTSLNRYMFESRDYEKLTSSSIPFEGGNASVFFDGSVLELFAGGRTISKRIYPSGPLTLSAKIHGGDVAAVLYKYDK